MKHDFRIIDSDMHIIEPPGMWEQYIDGAFKARAPKIVGKYPVGTYGLLEGPMLPTVDSHARARWNGMFSVVGPHLKTDAARGFDPIAQLAAMDREGVDVAALFPTIGLYVMGFDGLDLAFAAAICRAYNNWLCAFCQHAPERLRGVAMIPPHDIVEAITETRRAVKELGFLGVFLHPSLINGRHWHDRYFDPLWHELQELNVPVCFHEGERARSSQCFVGAEEERGLKQVVEQIGDDNIVWSSDYPHWDSDYPHASEAFLELSVSDETKHKILWDNCLRLYNLS